MKDSFDIVEAIRMKVEQEHENGYEVQAILLSEELFSILELESNNGLVETLLGYPVQVDPKVKSFGLVMYSMLN